MAVFCGTDIIEIERIKNSIESLGDAFRDRIYTEKEISYCEGKKAVKYQSYATRFAAKEAVSKAFGTGIGKGIKWVDIEVDNDQAGKPFVILYGKAKEIFEEMKGHSVSISLSHCKDYAIAYAVIEVSEVV